MTKRIVIVGAGISGLTLAFYLQRRGCKVTLIEKDMRAGGKLGSSLHQGFLFEHAANGMLPAPATLQLIADLDLQDQWQPASELAQRRHIYQDGALRPLPASPPALLASELLSPFAKARALCELLWRSPAYALPEETVHSFVRRHFGFDVAERFAQIAVQGITAGDARQLSLDALFPGLRALETEYGSLLRALNARRRALPADAPPRRLSSFVGGMQQLIDALCTQVHDVRLGCALERLEPNGKPEQGYVLHTSGGERLEADSLVLATPSAVSAQQLASIPALAKVATALATISYADVWVYGLGYRRVDVPHALDSFGYLVSREQPQQVRSLGVLFSSSLFPNRAPTDHVCLRVIAGGVPDAGFSTLSPQARWQAVQQDLRYSLGITAEPVAKQVIPWQRGIPQYLLGHRARVDALMKQAAAHNIYLTGNAYYGVAVNDCIADAQRLLPLLAS